jgi:hypothetical protein
VAYVDKIPFKPYRNILYTHWGKENLISRAGKTQRQTAAGISDRCCREQLKKTEIYARQGAMCTHPVIEKNTEAVLTVTPNLNIRGRGKRLGPRSPHRNCRTESNGEVKILDAETVKRQTHQIVPLQSSRITYSHRIFAAHCPCPSQREHS